MDRATRYTLLPNTATFDFWLPPRATASMPVIPNLAVITRTLNQKRLDKVMNVLYCVILTVFQP